MKISVHFLIAILVMWFIYQTLDGRTYQLPVLHPVSTGNMRQPPLPLSVQVKQELLKALKAVREPKAQSYHRLLHEAYHRISKRLLGLEWTSVQTFLKKHSFTITNVKSDTASEYRKYLLKKRAVKLPSGHFLHLYLTTLSKKPAGKEASTSPLQITEAIILLEVEVNLPYSEVIKEDWFPKGSVLDYVLNTEPEYDPDDSVRTIGTAWPFLKQLSVYYVYFPDVYEDYSNYGFCVGVEYVADLEKDIGRKYLSYKIISGLDPLTSQDGKFRAPIEFKQRDVLGTVSYLGGYERWQGDKETVDRNKHKYLKKPVH